MRRALLTSAPPWIVLGLLAAACVQVPPNATILRVEASNETNRATLQRELWRVERAVEDVKLRYGLDDIAVEVIVTEMGGLGATTPALDRSLHVQAAVVRINERLFLEEHSDLDEILLGLFAHELVHGLHDARMSRKDLIRLGEYYDQFLNDTDNEFLHDWIRHYERLTDMTAIALGYADVLAHQKLASEANLAQNHPENVWDFYLSQDEITTLDANREELQARIDEALASLELPSLTDWMTEQTDRPGYLRTQD